MTFHVLLHLFAFVISALYKELRAVTRDDLIVS
jgi:hypothetical protein